MNLCRILDESGQGLRTCYFQMNRKLGREISAREYRKMILEETVTHVKTKPNR